MYGFKLRYLKRSLLLIAALVVFAVAWQYLSRALFVVAIAGAGVLGGSVALSRNAWSQTHEDDSRSSPAAAGRGGKPRAGSRGRARKRVEVLHPEATVSLAEERREAEIEDVFTALDDQLVGLVPVKNKVEEIASLLLVDRVRHRFGLRGPPAQPAHVLHRRPGNREDHGGAEDGRSAAPAGLPGKGTPRPRHAR